MKLRGFKRVVAALVVTGLAFISPLVHADSNWGPSRPLYTYPGTGASQVQFNSFTNNPNYGDERIFFDGKDAANTSTGGFSDPVDVTNSQELLLRVYVHNNANQSLNGANLDGPGVALNTQVKIQLPTTAARSLRGQAFISASNATPGTVFDSLDFTTTSAANFSLSYVPGSAMITNAAHPNGLQLSDNIVTSGTQIGYDQMNGQVPGCFQYESVVTIKVKVNTPSISLQKQVTTPGSTNWQSSLNANVGDTDSWLLSYTNTSQVQVDDIVLKDQLPAHLSVVPGSVTLFDSNHPNGEQLSDTDLFTNGIDIGSLGVGGGGYIRYHTTVNSDFSATDCQDSLDNAATAQATGVSPVSSSATLVVTTGNTCSTTPPVTPTTPTIPVTPAAPVLPQTGPEDALAGVLGTTGLGYSIRAYLRSKKSLLDSLRRN